MTDETKKQPGLIAYAVRETSGKSYFTRIGAAWANAKGGFNLRLDALPVNGEIVLLPIREDEREPS